MILLTAGLALGVGLPFIKSWQVSQVDKILARSRIEKTETDKLSKLKQAVLIGTNDPVAIERLASNYWRVGEYNKSIATYQAGLTTINDLYLGRLALQSSQPWMAKVFYSQADRLGESAKSQAGLANVAFIENRVDDGCNHADRAKKLNLSSREAAQAIQICAIFQNTSNLTEREQAYLLINNFIFDAGIKQLEKLTNKSADDYLLLSRVYASRGEYNKANNAINNGLLQAPSNKELLKAKISILQASGKTDNIEVYQQRLQDLEFEKFQ
jgi:tetratricopeptide (TPR) repeat protein